MRRIKKAIRGDASYQSYTEHRMMEMYSIGYNELMSFPYKKYLEFAKIMTLEAKEKKRKQAEQKKKR